METGPQNSDVEGFRATFGWNRRIHCVRQTETSECGLACLTMILNYFGNLVDLAQLRELFGSSSRGTSLAQLISIAQAIGVEARPLRIELNEIRKVAMPYMAHFDLNHYVVVASISKRVIEILDPAYGRRKLTHKEFSDRFTGVVLELTPNKDFAAQPRRKLLSIRKLVFSPRGVKSTLVNVLIISTLLELIALAMPLATQTVIDRVIVESDTDLLGVVAIAFAALIILQVVAMSARSWSSAILSANLDVAWSGRLFTHLLRLPEAYFQKRQLGDVISRFGSLNTIQQTVASKSVEIALDGVMAILSLGMLFFYNRYLALASILTLLISLSVRIVSYGMMQETNISLISLSARQQSTFLESLRGVTEIKLLNAVPLMSSRYLNNVVATNNATISLQSLQIVFGALDSLLFGALKLAILYTGARLALSGHFTAGMLVAFMSYSDQFIGRMVALFDFGLRLKILRIHSDRLSDIALSQEEPHAESSRPFDVVDMTLEFEAVSFRYSDAEPWILRNCSLSVRASESIAIFGESGCGKSTLLKLACGLLEPTAGTIRIGGIDARILGKRKQRELISVVLQENVLFAGSIAENISFFDSAQDTSRIDEVSRRAGISDDIATMPMRFQTSVGDMGMSLSGGQRQRICLARALYRDPKILLLDEATSHLDVSRERKISENVKSMNITRIIVSHRPETILSADRQFELQNGSLREVKCVMEHSESSKSEQPEAV